MLTSLAPEEIRPASASELVSMVTAGGAPASPELVSTATVTVGRRVKLRRIIAKYGRKRKKTSDFHGEWKDFHSFFTIVKDSYVERCITQAAMLMLTTRQPLTEWPGNERQVCANISLSFTISVKVKVKRWKLIFFNVTLFIIFAIGFVWVPKIHENYWIFKSHNQGLESDFCIKSFKVLDIQPEYEAITVIKKL